MQLLVCLLLMGILAAQDPNGSQPPQPKEPFELTWYDIREKIHIDYSGGLVNVEFTVNEQGEVENPVILDTFNISLNEVVLDKVRQSKYYPATQNGRPVKVKYSLPIKFK